MNNLNSPQFACRHCQFYSPEGRRGGHCCKLGAPVKGEWKPCSLMIPSFAPAFDAKVYLESVVAKDVVSCVSEIYAYQVEREKLPKAV